MSRINNKNVKIGENYVLPIAQSSISRYEAKVESMLNNVEETKQNLLSEAEKEANNIKRQAEQIVENATKQAEEIINQATNQANKIIQQAETEKSNIEARKDEFVNQAKAEGFNKGLEDGLAQFKVNAKDSIKSLETLTESSFKVRDNIVKAADLDIIDLVVAIAKKITVQNFNQDMLKELTLAAISKLKNKEEITITVNPKLLDDINVLSETFRQEVAQIKNIKIIEDETLSCDGTIVESPLSRVDSRISSQIDEIAVQLINGIKDDVQQS